MQTVKGRVPVRQRDALNHAHIRILPRSNEDSLDDSENEHDDSIPTFRSASLQFSSPIKSRTQTHELLAADSYFPQVHTFADMARRYHQKDFDLENEQQGSTPIPSSGIVTLQSKARKAHEATLSTRRIDQDPDEKIGKNIRCIVPKPYGIISPQFRASSPSGTEVPATYEQQAASVGHTDNLRARGPLETISNNKNISIHTQAVDGDDYERLFGKLPDPIRLSEQTGDFDGQVVFIAHPSRDVSAHQWSSISFQWVNIGRYAHGRGKVEGSLASDCLSGFNTSQSPIECFKLAAEAREKLVLEHGRPGVEATSSDVHTMATDTHMTAQSKSARSLGQNPSTMPPGNRPFTMTPVENRANTPASLHATVRREYLEDPFVTSKAPPNQTVTSSVRSRRNEVDPKGSLDFQYEFPFRPFPEVGPYPISNRRQESPKGRSEGVYDPRLYDPRQMSSMLQPDLRDIAFGEDAAGGLARCQQSSDHSASIATYGRQMHQNNLADHSSHTTRTSAPPQARLVPRAVPQIQPTARSLFPPPGLTVANPHRITSALNASTPSYVSGHPAMTAPEMSGSQATVVNPVAATLKFSDPDGVRQSQSHDIINGLGQQAPTKQNFKGPFFTDSKPTASDPTVQLSVHVSEEQKLMDWYRDGHRPARQHEYAKTLITAAVASHPHSLGAIGQSVSVQTGRQFANTYPMVRLYEGLSEYVEECGQGTGRSYFSKAWKIAPPHMRDLGPEGNNSYFTRPSTRAARNSVA